MASEHTNQTWLDEDYMRFRRRLFARRELNWRLTCGSLYERPLHYVLTDPIDLDDLFWPYDIYAIVPQHQSTSKDHLRGTSLTVYTKDVHVGFAKLRTDANKFEFYVKLHKSMDFIFRGDYWSEIPNGASRKRYIRFFPEVGFVGVHDTLCRFDESWRNVQLISIDRVEAIYCTSWPPEAAEWINRKRRNGWPSKDDVDEIVQLGCHLVAKPHQSNPSDETQWRFSFSQAEIILISSWTDVQKYIYHVLRLIKSEVVKSSGGEDKTVLCTYFFKTLMLWACEEKHFEFWTDENLETSVGELICLMIEWLIEKRCPNYFIPGNNMIDHLTNGVDLSNDINSLLHYRERCLSALLSKTQKAYPTTEFSVSVPNNILHYMQLHLIFGNIVNPLQPKMIGRLMNELTFSKDFMPVLKSLYTGITQHLQLMISRNKSKSGIADDSELSSSARNSFALTIEESDPGYSSLSLSLNDSLLVALEKLILRTDIHKSTNSTENSGQLNRDNSSAIGEGTDWLDVENYKLYILRAAFEKLMENIKDIIGMPSYFISAAYRANFLYTGLRDYSSAVRQSDEACKLLEYQQKTIVDDNITKGTFYFMLTNEWSAIFDEHIQIVLGFTALYRAVFKASDKRGRLWAFGSDRTIVVRLCAIEFLCYVKCQCLRLLGKPCTPFLRFSVNDIPKKCSLSENYMQKFSNFFLYAALYSSYAHF